MNRILQIVFFSVISALTACGQFSIDVAPSQVSLKSGAQQQFLVSESNAQNPSGSWSVSSSACGSIDASGLFTAATVTSDQACGVSFTDAQNGKSASATLSVISLVDGPAELPRTVPNSSMASTPAPGKSILVPQGGLQMAINSAACGDTLQLEAGASYSGAYTLPAKPCDDGHWVVIRTAAPDSLLPAEGTRINPCYSGVLSLPGRPVFGCSPASSFGVTAKIIAPKGIAPLTLAAGANHYRIGPGLEITRTVGAGLTYGLIMPAGAVNNIVIDRDWIHGTAQDETTRGIFLSGMTSAAIVESYLNDFHCSTNGACSDAQAIAGGTGPLPQGNWKISGNFLEASAENILFGGVQKNSVTPADITIINNHLFKPLNWMPSHSGFVGGKETATAKCPQWDPTGTIGQCPFVVKNLFELKNAQRVLLEGNVLENVWPGFSQQGESILLSGLNPAALPGAPIYSTISIESVTLRYNRIAHTTGGMNIVNMAGQGSGTAPAAPNLPVRNVSAHDNVFDDMSRAYVNNGDGSSFNLFNVSSSPSSEPLTGISIRHNSVFSSNPRMLFILGSPQPQQLEMAFVDNIVTVPAGLTVTANGTPCGNTGSTNLSRIAACLVPNYKFAGNVFIGATNAWPVGNFLPKAPSDAMFANYASGNGGDYHLLPVSPFAGKGTDGKDPGADVDKVNAATSGVV